MNGGALYNEIDPYAIAWLTELESAGAIAPGRIDARSIIDLSADDVRGAGQRHFFGGVGGWSCAMRIAGVPDNANVWSGSAPCQPFSKASGHGNRAGVADKRHLWPAWFRLIEQCGPDLLFGEQVANRDGLGWLDAVFADLEGAGYACAAANTCAAGVGAPHIRQRLYFVAFRSVADRLGDAGRDRDRKHARELPRDEGQHEGRPTDGDHPSGAASPARYRTDPRLLGARGHSHPWLDCDWLPGTDGRSRPIEAESKSLPLVTRLPGHVEQLRGYGNALNVYQAAAFITAALEAIDETQNGPRDR